jgi:hypothetical protein
MADWFDAQEGGAPVDVRALLDSQGADALWECVAAGALVSVGLTSDGGALGVTITVDGRWRRVYVRDEEAFSSWMAEALPAVSIATKARDASSVSRSRQRGTRAR